MADRGDKEVREQEEGETTIAIPVDIPGSLRYEKPDCGRNKFSSGKIQ